MWLSNSFVELGIKLHACRDDDIEIGHEEEGEEEELVVGANVKENVDVPTKISQQSEDCEHANTVGVNKTRNGVEDSVQSKVPKNLCLQPFGDIEVYVHDTFNKADSTFSRAHLGSSM